MDPNYLPITSLTLETIIIRRRTQHHGVNKELHVIKIHVQTDAHLLKAKRVTDVMPLGLHHNRHHLPHHAASAAVALSSASLVQTVLLQQCHYPCRPRRMAVGIAVVVIFLCRYVVFQKTDAKREREKVYSPRYNNTAVKTDSNKTQSGGLPERHKAHLSWPPKIQTAVTTWVVRVVSTLTDSMLRLHALSHCACGAAKIASARNESISSCPDHIR